MITYMSLIKENGLKYIMAIDDTDMPDTKGTGWLVQALCEQLERQEWATCSTISRHQLFVHEDVPYTSHNSTMCVELDLTGCSADQLQLFAADYLKTNHARGSDPGLCLARMDDRLDIQGLTAFGLRAKTEVLTLSHAFDTARQAGIHLSAHGGTGQGVIGALAGAGLRLTGHDGRYRGWYHFGRPGDVVTAGSLCTHSFVDLVATSEGRILEPTEHIMIGSDKTKTVRIGYQQVIPACLNKPDGKDPRVRYRTLTKAEAKKY